MLARFRSATKQKYFTFLLIARLFSIRFIAKIFDYNSVFLLMIFFTSF